MTILVTGNQGFIGCWLNIYLSRRISQPIIGIDNRSSFGKRLYDYNKYNFNLNECQYNDSLQSVDSLLKIIETHKVTSIFHLAGQAIVPRSFDDPELTFKSNVITTFNILEAVRRSETVKSACLITSDKVYKNDNKESLFSESDQLGGKDIYSTSKVICEELVYTYRKTHLANPSKILEAVRLGNVVGGGDYSINRLLPDLVHAYLASKPFEVRYPSATRPFQHVIDVCDGLFNILLNNELHTQNNYQGSCWNLGPLNNTSMIVGDVIELFNSKFQLSDIKRKAVALPEDILLAVSNSKYVKQFSPPIYDSRTAIVKALDWYNDVHTNKRDPWHLSVSDVDLYIANQ